MTKPAHDLVIRGGTVDGSGSDRRSADIAASDGGIALIGEVAGTGREETDINIIDHGRLRVRTPEFAYDLPAGGRRLVPRAEGYRYTIVAGEITYRNGVETGALPGRLVRGTRPARQATSEVAA